MPIGPCKLDILDVLADDLAVAGGQTLQPLPNRLAAGRQGVEESGQLFHRLTTAYHFWYVQSKGKSLLRPLYCR
jgi:hypothetical protein